MYAMAEAIDGNPLSKRQDRGVMHTLESNGAAKEVEAIIMKKKILREINPTLESVAKDRSDIEAKYLAAPSYKFTKKDTFNLVDRSILDIPHIPVTAAMKKYGQEWTVNRLYATLLNMGNADNMNKTIDGHGISEDTLHDIAELFSKEAIEGLQTIGNSLSSMFDELDAVNFRLTNQHLKKVEVTPIVLTDKAGNDIALEGWYYPLQYDAKLDDSVARREEQLASKKTFLLSSNTPNSDSRKERNAKVKKPVLLDINVLLRHIDNTTRDIALSEYLNDMNKITNHPDFKSAMREKFSHADWKAIRKVLNKMANPNEKQEYSDSIGVMESYIAKAGAAILQFKPKIGIKQRLSIFDGIRFMDGGGANALKYMWQAAREVGVKTHLYGSTNDKVVQNMYSLSDFMRIRGDHMDDIVNFAGALTKPLPYKVKLGGIEFSTEDFRRVGFWLIRSNDMATTTLLWRASFNQAIGENISMTEGMTEDQRTAAAVSYADDAVRKSQPSTLTIDKSAWQSSSVLKPFMMFMTYQVKMGNNVYGALAGRAKGNMTNAAMTKTLFANLILPAFTMAMSSMLWSQLFGEDEEDLEDTAKGFAANVASSVLAPIPIVNQFPSMVKFGKQAGVPAFVNVPYKLGEDLFTANDLGEAAMAGIQVIGFATNANVGTIVKESGKVIDGVKEATK